jgi:hypothetical protein
VSELFKLGTTKFEVRATVRSAQAKQLMVDLGVALDNVFTVDLSSNDPAAAAALRVALQGVEALVVCTSAVPQPQVLPTLLGAAGHWFRQKLSRQSGDDPFVPVATWKGGQTPQQVRCVSAAPRMKHYALSAAAQGPAGLRCTTHADAKTSLASKTKACLPLLVLLLLLRAGRLARPGPAV